MARYHLDPESELYKDSGIVIVGGFRTSFEVLGRQFRNTKTPFTGDYIHCPSAGSGYTILDLTSFSKSPISTVSTVDIYLYAEGPGSNGDDVEITILNRTNEVFFHELNAIGGVGWYSAHWVSGDMTQQFIHDLRLRLRIYRAGTSPKIYSAYVEVNTTETSLIFNPPKDNYKPIAVKKWRPRLKPGAFWV
jgi:hypothetical protein